MPRQPRVHYPHAVYHVMSRGVDKRPIYQSESDFRTFLSLLASAFSESRVMLFAYCLMNNHFHLLLSVSDTPLALPMQSLLARYSSHFNQTHQRVGHLFQARYTALLCQDMAYLIHLVSYIHFNPVRAGLVTTPAQWPWSSHTEFMTGEGGLLRLDGLEEATGMTYPDMKGFYLDRLDTLARKTSAPVSLDEILMQVACQAGITPSELTSGKRGDAYSRAKLAFIINAEHAGYRDSDIARALNCSRAAVTQLKQRKC